MRILVAEDDSITRRLLQAHLSRSGHEVVVCSDGGQAWNVLNGKDPPNLVVLDWMMPGMDGVTICRELRKREGQRYTYIILLTGKTRTKDVIEGLEAGADDYIMKPFDAHELKIRVRAGSRIIQLQQDLVAALAASEYQASHDHLTGLCNRRAITSVLDRELDRAHREHSSVGVIIGDLDHFKRINDTYGHLAGDAALREVAKRIVSFVRPSDVVGRYGGEEILIVCPGSDREGTRRMAERVRQALSESPLIASEGTFEVTMTFGVTSIQQEARRDSDSVIREADEALYRAKEMGRNRVEVWLPHPGADLGGNDSVNEGIHGKWVQLAGKGESAYAR
jgi:two-component system cell cycle response regulator